MTPEERIVSELANEVCQRIARQTRIGLQKMTDCRLSGADTPLKNSWEEICVQLQSEKSIFWLAYEETMRAFVTFRVAALPRYEIEAVWLQTDEAVYSLDDHESEVRPAINEATTVDFILNNFIYADAENWSNKRIRDYLDSPTD